MILHSTTVALSLEGYSFILVRFAGVIVIVLLSSSSSTAVESRSSAPSAERLDVGVLTSRFNGGAIFICWNSVVIDIVLEDPNLTAGYWVRSGETMWSQLHLVNGTCDYGDLVDWIHCSSEEECCFALFDSCIMMQLIQM